MGDVSANKGMIICPKARDVQLRMINSTMRGAVTLRAHKIVLEDMETP